MVTEASRTRSGGLRPFDRPEWMCRSTMPGSGQLGSLEFQIHALSYAFETTVEFRLTVSRLNVDNPGIDESSVVLPV
jgi:hypothetical protein